MTALRTLDHLDLGSLNSAPVFVRVDFNVPIEDGRVADDTRLVEALSTLRELSAAGARVLLASHLGRPKGSRREELSLAPVARRLGELLGGPVAFAPDCVGPAAAAAAAEVPPGGFCLLENLRFHAGEEADDPGFADALSALAPTYVGDAFGAAHRAHASVVGVPERAARKAAGRLLQREVAALSRLLGEPERPFAAISGGAKIGGKIETLENLLPRLDCLMVGGGMANTLLAAQGLDLGASLVEEAGLDTARTLLDRAGELGVEVMLPTDLVVTDDLDRPGWVETVAADAVPAGGRAVDVGPRTREAFSRTIATSRTLFWNGPLGVFEREPFDAGTREVARALADCPGFTVLGGGETVAAARRAGVADRVGHVSTGGGASLEFLAGKTLPGIAALEEAS